MNHVAIGNYSESGAIYATKLDQSQNDLQLVLK